MNFIGIDLEGVLVPEIWKELADKTGEEDLKLTTRDIDDYEELMAHRINVLNAKGIRAEQLFDVAKKINPFKGAIDFLNKIRSNYQVIILSDTFYNLSKNIFFKLNYPTVVCHKLIISKNGMVEGMSKCANDHKRKVISFMNKLNYHTLAIGDSLNDLSMLREAKDAILFRSTKEIIRKNPNYVSCESYSSLLNNISKTFERNNND